MEEGGLQLRVCDLGMDMNLSFLRKTVREKSFVDDITRTILSQLD